MDTRMSSRKQSWKDAPCLTDSSTLGRGAWSQTLVVAGDSKENRGEGQLWVPNPLVLCIAPSAFEGQG